MNSQDQNKKGGGLLVTGGVLMIGLIIGVYFLLSDRKAEAGGGLELDSFGTVASDVRFTRQDGKEIALGELRGKFWIASFIFTRCRGVCPVMTESLSQLQSQIDPDDPVVLVSFTVDPEYDTPERLTEYASQYNADPNRWIFLNASDSVIQQIAQQTFHVAIAEGTDPQEPIVHSSKLFLVDGRGEIRGIFDGRSEEGRSSLLSLLKRLQEVENN
ncbi:MAG: SCO family protein [Candidatus Kapaibacterium sp.]